MQRLSLTTLFVLSFLSLCVGFGTVQAQRAGLADRNPDASISFPPSVYVLRGAVEILGDADVENMLNYFLEYRKLGDDLSVPNDAAPWLPATLPSRRPLREGALGVWDTTLTSDGLYELRLTVNVRASNPIFHIVSPLRIENDTPNSSPGQSTSQPGIITATPRLPRVTQVGTPTPFATGPTVTALTDANVRQGDDVAYQVVGSLLTGQSAPIVGISTRGTGWYYIQLASGRRGFISPSVVSVSGSIEGLDRIIPPATPTPTFTPTPPTNGNLLINGNALVPDRPRCNEQFEVQLNVTNNGARPTNTQVTIRITDQDVATGTVTTSGSVTVPVIAVGGNHVAVIPLTIGSFPGVDHRINAVIDADFQLLEENENDNVYAFTYRLRQGNCP
ncbi:MAG: hypothetical protein H7Y11_06740 [Armatimonadetes bacterium]|nr:hypothetical protein [Anaerolineae bacterium]